MLPVCLNNFVCTGYNYVAGLTHTSIVSEGGTALDLGVEQGAGIVALTKTTFVMLLKQAAICSRVTSYRVM